jgi:hypothetical protein
MTKSQDQILSALLEKILFNQKELNLLKEKIKQVSQKNINPNDLRTHIFGARIHIMEELLEFFPFYAKETFNNNVSDESNRSLPSGNEEDLLRQIEEREDLLKLVAKRLMNIYSNLKEPNNTGSGIKQITDVITKDQKQNETRKKLAVDITNILNLDKDKNGEIKIENVLNLYNTVVKLGFVPHLIADASMKYQLDSDDQYEDLKDKKIIYQSPAGTEADEWVLEVAKREGCKFLTNDLYRDYRNEFGKDWINSNRLTCFFSNGKFIIRESKKKKTLT